MMTTYSNSNLNRGPAFGLPELKTALLEPVLVVSVSAFWIATLPVAVVSMLCLKLWDSVSGRAARDNPLILRRGGALPNDGTLPAGDSTTPAKA